MLRPPVRLVTIVALVVFASTAFVTPVPAQVDSGTTTPSPPPTPTTPIDPMNGSTNATTNSSGGILGGGLVAGVGDVLRTYGVDQPLQALASIGQAVIQVATYTPHANNVDNWFHNPTNGVWATNWNEYQNKGQPLWAFLVIIGGAGGIAARAGGLMSASEFKEWRRRWLVGLVVGRWAWELGNLYLLTIGGLKLWFVGDLAASGGTGTEWAQVLVLVLVVALALFNVWIVIIIAGVVGMTIIGIDIFTPYLGALLAARGIPIKFVNGAADKGARFWAILPALTVPMAMALSAGFSTDITAIIEGNGFPAVMVPFIHLGAFFLAILSPYIVWSGASSTTAFSLGFAGGSVAMSQRYEQAKQSARRAQQKGTQSAQGVQDVARGARGKAPVADGGRGYDAGRAVRQTTSGLVGRTRVSAGRGVRDRVRQLRGRTTARTASEQATRQQIANQARDMRRTKTMAALLNDK